MKINKKSKTSNKNKKNNSSKSGFRKDKLNVRLAILSGVLVLMAVLTSTVAVAAMRRDDPDFGVGIVTISFINGYKSQYDTAQKKMKELNIPATYFMPTDLVNKPNRMSLKNLRTLSKQGHEFANMTAESKTLLGLTQEQVFSRYDQTQKWFEKNVGVTPNTCLYTGSPYQNDPYGEDLLLPSPIRKASKDSRLDFTGCAMNAGGMMVKTTFNNWRIENAKMSRTINLYEMQHMINNVVGARTWINITYAQVGEDVNPNETFVSQELFDQTMEHIAYWRDQGMLIVPNMEGALEVAMQDS